MTRHQNAPELSSPFGGPPAVARIFLNSLARTTLTALLIVVSSQTALAASDPVTNPRVGANRPMNLSDNNCEEELSTGVDQAYLPPIILASCDQDQSHNKKLAPSVIRPAAYLAQTAPPNETSEPDVIRDDSLIESILIRGQTAERITVSRNMSAAINLKRDVDAVEISEPTIADVSLISPRLVVVTGRAFGMTQLILRVADEQRTFSVSVEHDVAALGDLIRSICPTAQIKVRSVNGTLLLSGTVPDAITAERVGEVAAMVQGGDVRNQLTVAGVQQTLLRVVVAEVNKDAMRELGVNWAIGGADWTRNFFFANNLDQLNPTVFTSSGLANVLSSNQNGGQLTYALGATANTAATNVTIGFPKAEFQLFMQALRQNALSRVLAEPNLVAISGQTATFLAGGEVPIPVTQGGAVAGSITIEYKEFGVRLAFTPTVQAGQIIRLHVMSEVSDAVQGAALVSGLPVFTFTTRRVESTIECGNGQTFALAGLLSERVRAAASKIPGLGDIPVIGTLFSSVNYTKNNTELVVLVTPQLIEPLDPQQVPPPPGSLMTDPNDFELFTLQKLEGMPKTVPETEGVPRERAPVNTRPADLSSWPSSQLAFRGPWGVEEFAHD
jgi:pilus assembly protein CpaC